MPFEAFLVPLRAISPFCLVNLSSFIDEPHIRRGVMSRSRSSPRSFDSPSSRSGFPEISVFLEKSF